MPPQQTLISTIHLAVTWALFGLIWVVQLVHYPAFRFIEPTQFQEFQGMHMQSITLIVMPLMLAELGLAAIEAQRARFRGWPLASLGLVILIWLSTFFWQMPLHDHLLSGKDNTVIDELVAGNSLRTALWTVKALLLTVLVLRAPAAGPAKAFVQTAPTKSGR